MCPLPPRLRPPFFFARRRLSVTFNHPVESLTSDHHLLADSILSTAMPRSPCPQKRALLRELHACKNMVYPDRRSIETYVAWLEKLLHDTVITSPKMTLIMETAHPAFQTRNRTSLHRRALTSSLTTATCTPKATVLMRRKPARMMSDLISQVHSEVIDALRLDQAAHQHTTTSCAMILKCFE